MYLILWPYESDSFLEVHLGVVARVQSKYPIASNLICNCLEPPKGIMIRDDSEFHGGSLR